MRLALFVSLALAACATLPELPRGTATRGRAHLRVASLNLYNPPHHRAERTRRQLALLRRVDADVIVLQEVATGIHLDGEPASIFAEALRFGGVRAWHQENFGIFRTGLAILSRYPIERAEYVPFAKSIAFDPKGYLSARIKTPAGPVELIDVHNASTGDAAIMRSQLAALLDAIRTKPGPIIMIGDFNVEPSDPLFAELNAYRFALDGPTWEGEQLDHALGRGVEFTRGAVIPTRSSDHCLIVIEAITRCSSRRCSS